MTGLTKASALKRIVSRGMLDALDAAEFEQVGRSLVWRNETPELTRIVTLRSTGGGAYVLNWGVFESNAARLIFGDASHAQNLDSAIVSGTSSSVNRPPSAPYIKVQKENVEEDIDKLALAVAEDVPAVLSALSRFATRNDVADYLENKDTTDPNGSIEPANGPLRLLFLSALKAGENPPRAAELLTEVRRGSSGFVKLHQSAIERIENSIR